MSSVSPETDVNESSSGENYAMTLQTSMCGHDTILSEVPER